VNLERLNAADNEIAALPEAIGNLSDLRYLDLSGNQLTNLPRSFCEIASLNEIGLADNPWPEPLAALASKASCSGMTSDLHAYLRSATDAVDKGKPDQRSPE
jgi:hypothetical protein